MAKDYGLAVHCGLQGFPIQPSLSTEFFTSQYMLTYQNSSFSTVPFHVTCPLESTLVAFLSKSASHPTIRRSF